MNRSLQVGFERGFKTSAPLPLIDAVRSRMKLPAPDAGGANAAACFPGNVADNPGKKPRLIGSAKPPF